MADRVRAVLITPAGALLTIKRIRPGAEPYWVLPGGGVEAADVSLEGALAREIREELGGEAVIDSLLHVEERDGGREYFYLARIGCWNPAARSGPEFDDPARGAYVIEEIPLTLTDLARITLRPAEIATRISGWAGHPWHRR